MRVILRLDKSCFLEMEAIFLTLLFDLAILWHSFQLYSSDTSYSEKATEIWNWDHLPCYWKTYSHLIGIYKKECQFKSTAIRESSRYLKRDQVD